MVTVPPGVVSAGDLDATAARSGMSIVSIHRAHNGRHDDGLSLATSVIVDDPVADALVTGAGYRRGPVSLFGAIVIFDRDLVPVAALWINAGRSTPGVTPASFARCVVHTLRQASNGSP